MFAISKTVVANALVGLRDCTIHPLFAGYLHLQQRSFELGRLENLEPKFVDFYKRFFSVADHPIGTPYIKPFKDHRQKNLWFNKNVAGSYAQSSLRAGQPFRRVVEVRDNVYSLKEDHPRLALEHLLHGKQISAAELALFLYRNRGLPIQQATVDDIVRSFEVEFGYIRLPSLRSDRSFSTLYRRAAPDYARGEITEPLADSSDILPAKNKGVPLTVTVENVRELTANDLLQTPSKAISNGTTLLSLEAEGVLSFGTRTKLEFGKLNILVGPNGSGKSNIIDCLRVFRSAPLNIQRELTNEGLEVWLYNGLDKQAGSGTLRIKVRVPEVPNPISHEIKLGPPSRSRAQLEELISDGDDHAEEPEQYFVGSYRGPAFLNVASNFRRRQKQLRAQDYDPFQSILSQLRDATQYPEITRLANMYSSIRIYSEWTFGRESKLREAAPVGRSDTQLAENMNDLPVALNALARTTAHEMILKLLPQLKETYRDYVTRLIFGKIGLEIVETPFEAPIPASRLSDGTLRFLALATILLQPDPSPVICVEEPELGMHPDMIRIVARMMVEASARTQLIITTHSEHLLNALQDEFDVLFAFNAGVNGSVVRQFSRDDFDKWREEHTLGELWTSGEFGGNRW